jgi:hypothetical protein
MADDSYSVKINRRDGVLEITGADKDWISDQLRRLAIIYTEPAPVNTSRGRGSTSAGEASTDPQAAETHEAKGRAHKRGGTTRGSRNVELEQKLTAEIKARLKAYVDERSNAWKKQTAQVAIISTFLLDELSWGSVDGDDIYTVCVTMGWPAPGNPRSSLENARCRNGYFGGWSDGRLQLSHKGENFGRHDSKDS